MKYDDIHELSLEPKWLNQAKALYKWLGYSKDPDASPFYFGRVIRLQQGAIDTHIHSGPDPIYRPQDEVDIGIQACQLGMAAVVYKSLHAPSTRSAIIAQRAVDQWAKENGRESTRLVGGVALDYPVGGLNPTAVRSNLRLGGKFVWTPVLDSSHHRKVVERPPGIEVIDKNGEVVPDLREIFKIIAKYDAVLALCHHTTRERFIMIDAAKEEGVKRILIVHPTESLVKMSIDQMKIAAQKGAYLELCCLDFKEPEVMWEEWIETIREVGADHIVLATDCGNWQFPPPVTQFRTFLGKLLVSGIPDADVEKMAKINPQKLIFGLL